MAGFIRRLAVAAAVLLGCLTGTLLGLGAVPLVADAQTCLPSPTVLFSEVARVVGTGSKLWGDIQHVEQADAAAGTSASGQVIQDMLSVVNRDGYQWDCTNSLLAATSGAASPARDSAGQTPVVTAPGQPSQTATPAGSASPDSSPAGDSVSPDTTADGLSALAAGAGTTAGRGIQAPTLVLAVLVLLTVGLLVIVVRRQIARH